MTISRTTPVLSLDEQAMLDGDSGEGVAMAMRLVVNLATAMGAPDLLAISGAHIDSCLYHGQSGLDFVERLGTGGAQVAVPTTLNVSSLDLLHPELYQGDDVTAANARLLMDSYVALGCEPTWTCAPYQRQQRPDLGEHLAWAESNAIVFANSVLGARTHRYGDFIDIAAAVTGRVPHAGLHVDAARSATITIDVRGLSPQLLASDAFYPCLGFVLGRLCDDRIPAIVGLPSTTSEDQFKALGAAAASSGNLAMFHAVGLTPEASTLTAAGGGAEPAETFVVSSQHIMAARDELSTASTGPLATVSLGTPHYSVTEIGALHREMGDQAVHPDVALYVSTGREVLHEAMLRGWVRPLESSGVTFVTDTCTYITPIVRDTAGVAMTDSAKWAYYAPGNIGVQTVFASLKECVQSAVQGRVVRDEELWRHG